MPQHPIYMKLGINKYCIKNRSLDFKCLFFVKITNNKLALIINITLVSYKTCLVIKCGHW